LLHSTGGASQPLHCRAGVGPITTDLIVCKILTAEMSVNRDVNASRLGAKLPPLAAIGSAHSPPTASTRGHPSGLSKRMVSGAKAGFGISTPLLGLQRPNKDRPVTVFIRLPFLRLGFGQQEWFTDWVDLRARPKRVPIPIQVLGHAHGDLSVSLAPKLKLRTYGQLVKLHACNFAVVSGGLKS
jgi:hypothetical protein